jgi:membrane associated rhomboid family serine protease
MIQAIVFGVIYGLLGCALLLIPRAMREARG